MSDELELCYKMPAAAAYIVRSICLTEVRYLSTRLRYYTYSKAQQTEDQSTQVKGRVGVAVLESFGSRLIANGAKGVG